MIQVEFRTHGTNAESIHGLSTSLMVVLSWWFAQGFYHAFSHGFSPGLNEGFHSCKVLFLVVVPKG